MLELHQMQTDQYIISISNLRIFIPSVMPAAFSFAPCFALHVSLILSVDRDGQLENILKEVLDYADL